MTETQVATETESAATPTASGVGRIVGGLALSLLSCVLIWVSFPDQGGLYPLLLVAFVPMYIAQYRVLPRRLSALPMFLAASTYWFPIWVTAWDLLPRQESLTYVVSLLFGAIYAVIAIFDRKFSERTRYRWFIVQAPLWWVALDTLTQENLWAGSNGWLAYRFAGATPLIQTVSIVSTPALTFLALMINATVALLFLAWIDRKWPQLTSVPVPARTRWSNGLIAFAQGVGYGGRFLPSGAAGENLPTPGAPWRSKNREVFEAVKTLFDGYKVYDNEIDDQSTLVESKGDW